MQHRGALRSNRPLYTPEERRRRDSSRWTLVQGVLAPLQFLAFLVSLGLVIRFLLTGHGEFAATVSIVVKTALLYTIMVTGCLWERDVFGRYLFAESFFWEDAVSMAVIVLHTTYLIALLSQAVGIRYQMFIALAGYAAYCINAMQFLRKFRDARAQRYPVAPVASLAVAIRK
jgi:3-vinyl bacteriochlorophyllide hydratase